MNDQPLVSQRVVVQFMGSEMSPSALRFATDAKGETHFNIPNHTEHIEAPAAKPNEIVVMARPLRFIERILRPLVKQ